MTDGRPVDAAGRPLNPAQMTIAMDARGLAGKEVDLACGTFEKNPAGDVDAWEDPDDPRWPDARQLRLLADLCGVRVALFFEPGPEPMSGWICSRRKIDGARCHPLPGEIIAPGVAARRVRAARAEARRVAREAAIGQGTLPI